MRKTILIAALLPLTLPAAAAAQQPTAESSDERRLSPEQVEKILAEAAARREGTARPAPEEAAEEKAPPPQVHGEVGFAIGTGGYREAYGTAIYPLGNDGFAAISLDFVDLGRRRFRY